jgi:hypothetical protein
LHAVSSEQSFAVAARKRRDRGFATVVIVFGVIAAAVTLLLLTRSRDRSGDPFSTPAQSSRPRVHGHLVFGMTPQQVLRRTGQPSKIQGNCWLFSPTKAGIVGTISVQPSWSRLPYDPRTQGGLELCFTAGHYSHSYQHMFDPRKQKWVWFPWPLTRMQGSLPDASDGV